MSNTSAGSTAASSMAAASGTSQKTNWALVIGVQIAAIIEILDITIVNVSLPHMLGTFGATPDQITWVLTSYLVSQAIVMPLTGYLSTRLGRRRLLYTAVTGFIIASILCGLAWDLQSMVIFRLMQGLFGATLIPLAQSILFDNFPKEKRGQAMAIFGLGIMVAPIFGPVLGGYLTETYSWRTVFYINLPLGLLCLFLIMGRMPKDEGQQITTDWRGLILMAAAIGCLQFVIDQGETLDWFDSKVIQVVAFLAFISAIAFFIHCSGHEKPIIDLKLFKDRNFAAACISIFSFGIGMFGTIALIPMLTQKLMGYPPETAGMLFFPRAIAAMFTMIIVGGFLIKKIDARWLVAGGIISSGFGTFLMTNYNLQIDSYWLAMPGIFIGIGSGLFFVPLSTVAFNNIAPEKMDEASGLFSVTRTIGSSIGIAIVSSLFVQQTKVHWQTLSENLKPFSPELQNWLLHLGMTVQDPKAMPIVGHEMIRQAQMLAFVDLFWFIGWATLVIVPLAFLMDKPKPKDGLTGGH